MYYCSITSPIGELKAVTTEKGLSMLLWDHQEVPDAKNYRQNPSHPHLKSAKSQILEYFRGERIKFDLPIDVQGTDFQKKSWSILKKIPFAQTISYKKQADSLGDAKKARAIGGANGKNPLPIIIPCHRVIAANGKLTGFAGGLDCKKYLIDHEVKVKAKFL